MSSRTTNVTLATQAEARLFVGKALATSTRLFVVGGCGNATRLSAIAQRASDARESASGERSATAKCSRKLALVERVYITRAHDAHRATLAACTELTACVPVNPLHGDKG